MANQGPLCGSKERMRFDIGSSRTCTKTSILIFDEKFSDQRLAEAKFVSIKPHRARNL